MILCADPENTTSFHNLNLIYFSYTSLFLAFTKEITGKHGLKGCMLFQVCLCDILWLLNKVQPPQLTGTYQKAFVGDGGGRVNQF